MIYIYDGSFNGLLTAVFEAYYRHEEPAEIRTVINHQINILDDTSYIATDTDKASRVYEAIVLKISEYCLQDIYYTYLSNFEDSGTLVYRYLKLGFSVGKKLNMYQAHESVIAVRNIVYKVMGERHRLLGLLRFSKLDCGVYYAPVSPDHNVLELLAPHFAERMGDQDWIIHDTKRKTAAVCKSGTWYMTDFDSNQYDMVKENEADYQAFWSSYYKNINITERSNINLQKRNMPVRYWKYLTEKQVN
ncbi:MAG: TIGR03915 family putative DNA repair protein [Bacillota bacterium]|nr:TIGR03915 family putative DNA repair protein [Bacillota bacterium]